jgi:hypothetical protein
MSVIVQYIVKVSDVDRFVATSDKYAQTIEEMGFSKRQRLRGRERARPRQHDLRVGQPRSDARGVREGRR